MANNKNNKNKNNFEMMCIDPDELGEEMDSMQEQVSEVMKQFNKVNDKYKEVLYDYGTLKGKYNAIKSENKKYDRKIQELFRANIELDLKVKMLQKELDKANETIKKFRNVVIPNNTFASIGLNTHNINSTYQDNFNPFTEKSTNNSSKFIKKKIFGIPTRGGSTRKKRK